MQTHKPYILSLATLPAHEMLRTPITLLLTVTAACSTLITPLVIAFQFGDTGRRLVRDGGLGLQLTIGTILAATCACTLIRRERESGITAMLLTKPVSRPWYLLSRFLGIGMIILLFTAIITPATMLAHRAAEAFHPEIGFKTDTLAALSGLLCIPLACLTGGWYNWKKRYSFHAVTYLTLPAYLAGACLLAGFYTRSGSFTRAYQPDLDLRIIVAALSLMLVLLIFAAMALSMSTYLPPVSTALVCLMILFGGFSTPLLLSQTTSLQPLVALLPNWNLFWLTEAMDTSEQHLPFRFLLASGYGLLWLSATVLLGMTLMKRVEVPS